MIAWLCLFLAGITEIAWAVSMKLSNGFSKAPATIASFLALAISISSLSYAMKTLPVSLAYAIWVGIGVVGVAAIGVLWLKEPISVAKVLCLLLIIAGSIGLKVLD